MSQYNVRSQGTPGAAPIETITGNSGSVVVPTGGNVNIVGSGDITTSGAASTLTIAITGTTDHAVQIGDGTGGIESIAVGTTGQVLIGSTAADPAFGALGVNSGLTANSLVLSQGNSAFTALGAATNGQIPIGSTGANPVLATISPGVGISIGTGAGLITISATGGGFTWSLRTTNGTMAAGSGYQVTSGALSLALPSTVSSSTGDAIQVVLLGGTSWTVTQAAGQQIRLGNATTTLGVGGSLASTDQGDWIELVYSDTGLWVATARQGNITIV